MDLYWVALQHNVSPFQRDAITKLGITGLGFEDEPTRYYPENELAANVLGFVAENDRGENRGYFGVEGYFDGDLRGKDGRIIEERDAVGAPILVGGYKKVDPIDGGKIVLSIDRVTQYIVEKRLKEGVEKYDAKSGSVIVADSQNGNVLAMANYPTYNPADFSDIEESSDTQKRKKVERRNLSISQTYEPGSVMKPFTIAAAIDLGKVTPETTFNDEGSINYSGYYINNWDGKHYGVQNIIQLLQKSNNIGAAWVGHQLGSTNLYTYLSKFGFGKETGIELEGEDTGILRDSQAWTDIDLANISFGQGISATPLQVIMGFNSLINGGNLYQPRIVTSIANNGKTLTIPARLVRKTVSKKTSDTLVDLLVKAVAGGESKYFNIKNYIVGGKTGTAQIPINGKYDPSKTNSTFVGFFLQGKRLSMIVRLEEPTTSIYAAETAVPLWMILAQDLAQYYGMTPDM